jgi:predicted PurR-regulated permease PerM
MNEKWSLPTRYYVLTFVIILVTLVLYYVRDLMKPLALAAFIAYLLSPVVAYFSRVTRTSIKTSATIVYIVSLLVFIATVSSTVPIMVSQLEPITRAFEMVAEQAKPYLAIPISIGPFILDLRLVIPAIQKMFSLAGTPVLEDALQLIESTSKSAAYFLLIIVGTFYFMNDWAEVREWFIRLAPESYRHDIRHLYIQIRSVWLAYLRGQIVLMLIVGIVFTMIYLIIGLPGAILVGVLTGLLTLIPDVGPLIGTIVAVIVALLEGSNTLPLSNFFFALLIIGIYSVLMVIKNIWLRPYIMGRAVRIHEGLVFVAIIAAVIYQGILGALIVVPVMASVMVIGGYVRRRLLGLPSFPVFGPENDVLPLEAEKEVPKITRMHPRQKKSAQPPRKLKNILQGGIKRNK